MDEFLARLQKMIYNIGFELFIDYFLLFLPAELRELNSVFFSR
jgi:hypothetical protein